MSKMRNETRATTGFAGGGGLLVALAVLAFSTVSSVCAEETVHAYNLVQVDAKGDNTITKFVWNDVSKEFDAKYFRVDLNKNEYGSGAESRYYYWDFNGIMRENYRPEGSDIVVKFDSDRLKEQYNSEMGASSLDGVYYNLTNSSNGYGGAIDNYYGNLDSVSGIFAGNSADYMGGAIDNSYGYIGSITADFIGNYVSGYYGSAIANYKGEIGSITGDFIGNAAYGHFCGAIANDDGYIGSIDANFIGNYGFDNGGAIFNNGEIGAIKGDFINNTTQGIGYGGAIYNNWIISSITADFIGNKAGNNGAAIYNTNYGNIGDIKGNFVNNTLISYNNYGGAIYNQGNINNITANFENNTADLNGGAIDNHFGVIKNIEGNFIHNTVSRGTGGAICNDGTIEKLSGNFADNSAKYGGAISNTGSLSQVSANFVNNSAEYGGAIFKNTENGSDTVLVNSNFYNNKAVYGGAIYADKITVAADNGTSVIKDNYVEYDGIKYNNAFFIENELNLEAKNNGKMVIDDTIDGLDGYNVNINGDKNSVVTLNSDVWAANISLANTNLSMGNEAIFDTSNLNLQSGSLSMINNKIGNASPISLTVSGNTNMLVDVDLSNESMDRITAGSYGEHKGTLSVTGMNLLSDAKSDHTEIYFAETGLKDNVKSGLNETNSTYQTTAYTPIYKYGVSYDNREDGGYFLFDRAGAYSSNPSDSFNPAVLDSSVSAQAGTQSALNETVRFAFQHMDMFSQMPSFQRMAIINQNKYAIKDVPPKYNSDFETLDKGYWVKPFTSFESINLHHGPSVDAITYGTLVGFDGNFRELKHDWYNVQSIYAGYIGSQMSYTGVDTSLNGGVLGLTETFYKGNFFGALTATAGASLADSSTMYGNEDFTSLLGGVGAKTGYNFEFKNGKYILQPIMFMNYSFVNTFDYTNAAKVKIKSDPLHTFQINPQLKFIANLDKGWQPYASVGFVWNVLNSSKVRANDVVLPRMSVDPYVEYGLGVQRNWKDRFTGFAQAMVRNGGRNGVALTFGFRWALGKEAEDL